MEAEFLNENKRRRHINGIYWPHLALVDKWKLLYYIYDMYARFHAHFICEIESVGLVNLNVSSIVEFRLQPQGTLIRAIQCSGWVTTLGFHLRFHLEIYSSYF